MTLKEFILNFIEPNTIINLIDYKEFLYRKKDSLQQDIKTFELPIIWKGMEWQITNEITDNYYKTHPNVAPCPYGKSKVMYVNTMDTDTVSELTISIIPSYN